jgi:hypothetical protein
MLGPEILIANKHNFTLQLLVPSTIKDTNV